MISRKTFVMNAIHSMLLLVVGAQALPSSGIEAHLIRTTWGAAQFDDPSNWASWFYELKRDGYTGIESPTWLVCGDTRFSSFGIGGHECNETRAGIFAQALNQSGLYYVAQIHTCGETYNLSGDFAE